MPSITLKRRNPREMPNTLMPLFAMPFFAERN